SKYEFQEFTKPSLRTTSSEKNDLNNSHGATSSKMENFVEFFSSFVHSFLHYDWFLGFFFFLKNPPIQRYVVCSNIIHDNYHEPMVEFIGTLKVKVVKGTNLAVRDMLSSDPYVVINLGQQSAQTSVMGSNLNPIWNEVLRVFVPKKFGFLKVQVFDHDTFSADDIMGEAEVDLQPLISSAMHYKNPTMYGNMQIGSLAKSERNALIHDSPINIVDGKVKQEISLDLQNVESGQLELQLEWTTSHT
ncbi:hypothetical protein V2J09_022799, partial [Rumex salicifolius]